MDRNKQPDYTRYSIMELRSVLAKIDRERLPERYEAAANELQKRLPPDGHVTRTPQSHGKLSMLPAPKIQWLRACLVLLGLSVCSFVSDAVTLQWDQFYCSQSKQTFSCVIQQKVQESIHCNAKITMVSKQSQKEKTFQIKAQILPFACKATSQEIADTIAKNLEPSFRGYDGGQVAVVTHYALAKTTTRHPLFFEQKSQ